MQGIAHYRVYNVKIVSVFKELLEGGDKLHKYLLESIECAKGVVQKCLRIQEGHFP